MTLRRTAVLLSTLTVCVASLVPGLTATGTAAPVTTGPVAGVRTLLGTVPALAYDATDLGALNPLRRLRIALPLALPDQSALDGFVADEYQRGSAQFHRFIFAREFGARFGAAAPEVDRVTSTLEGLGLKVSAPTVNHLYISASGTVAQLEQIFGTTIHLLRLGNGASFFANLRDITLPEALVGAVTGVIGLDNTDRPQAQTHGLQATPATTSTGPIGQSGGVTPCPASIAGAGYTAPQLATAYNFNGLYKKGFLGQGMSIALLEFDDYHDSNVAQVESCYGLHTPVSRVIVDGGTGGPPAAGEAEDMADITTILEMLPKLSHLYVYVAPSTGLGEIDLFNRFAVEHRAPVMSSSWGNCEELNSAADNRLYSLITEEAAAQGQQIFTASGDSGAVDCRGYPVPTEGSISVEQEAAVPWVTGVGGTDLGQNTANGIGATRDEATWNSDGAAGGGVSTLWPMPAWQHALKSARTAPGRSSKLCGAVRGQLCREVPDISADADPGFGQQGAHLQFGTRDVGSLGYSIYCGTPNCSLTGVIAGLPLPTPGGLGGWEPIGGTSLSTPLTAAASLLWDQEARHAGLSPYGLLNPSLYQDAASPARYARDFHDITTDTNSDQYDTTDCPNGCNPHHLYRARKGYDMATGLGSYDATNLGSDLVKLAASPVLSDRHVTVYGYTHGVATTAPVVVSSGLHKSVRFVAHSNRRWLHVRSGRSTGKLTWSASPKGLRPGTYRGRITIRRHGHRSSMTVVYSVSKPATLKLSTRALHFSEQALDDQGKPTAPTCGGTLWGDELYDAVNGSSGTKVPASTKRVLGIKNAGPKGSTLHWQAFPYSEASSWLGTDLKYGKLQTVPGRALVPTDGAERSGQTGRLRLVSVADGNALGGYPVLNQGSYHGLVKIVDLADPHHRYVVPATLRLGSGKKTPTVHASAPSSITVVHGSSKTIDLKLSDASHGCGYAYSVSSSQAWAAPNADDFSGTVPAAGAGTAGGTDTGAGSGLVPVVVSAKHLAKGRHVLRLTVQSQNAEPDPLVQKVTVRVT